MREDHVSQVAVGILGGDAQRSSDSRVWQPAPPRAELPQRKLSRGRWQFLPLPSAAQRVSLLDLEDDATVAALGRLHAEFTAAFGARAALGARVPALEAWRESHPEWRSWVLGLHDGNAELRAVAPLALRPRAGLLQIRFIGDQCPAAWRSDCDASELAKAIGSTLQNLRRPWSIHLHQLPAGSAFTDELSRQLGVVEIRAGHDCPVVLVDGIRDPREVVSRNLRGAEAKARNRINRAGLAFEMRWIVGSRAIAERIPEVRLVHRQRDLQLRGMSLLDEPHYGAYYDASVRRHLDQLELLEIHLDGELGAYVLWLRDGPARLVLDNRVAPRWTSYSAGLIANNEALRRAAADPAVEVLDWGQGRQRYKLQSANKVHVHVQLCAWSSWSLRLALAGRRTVGRFLSPWIRVGPGPRAALTSTPASYPARQRSSQTVPGVSIVSTYRQRSRGRILVSRVGSGFHVLRGAFKVFVHPLPRKRCCR